MRHPPKIGKHVGRKVNQDFSWDSSPRGNHAKPKWGVTWFRNRIHVLRIGINESPRNEGRENKHLVVNSQKLNPREDIKE